MFLDINKKYANCWCFSMGFRQFLTEFKIYTVLSAVISINRDEYYAIHNSVPNGEKSKAIDDYWSKKWTKR